MNNEQLYNAAKEAYYNGQPIMSDIEFDELESDLGLENKGYVGTRHNPSYTIKHPFIMGSLSKVQIKEDEQGNVDWIKYSQEIEKYIFKNGQHHLIITPKYDGCSYECVVTNGKVESISSRGDGEYGKDLYNHLINHIQPIADSLIEQLFSDDFIFRGEVLVSKKIFKEKYSEFVNPRSFVAGLLNRDYEANDTEMKDMLSDLSLAVFDIRINEEGNLIDIDCDELNIPNFNKDVYILYTDGNQHIDFKNCLPNIYNTFSELRNNIDFALDGFVIKPVAQYRESLLTEVRPSDCVAVKFIPMLEETEIIGIEWNTGKTSELRPVIIVKPVIMDGKQVTRASAHNYGYLIDNKISVGTKVILSLAGDIIPFIYKVTDTTQFDVSKLCLEGVNGKLEGCHLYKNFTVEEIREMKFIQSALALKIPNIGEAAAKIIYDYMVKCSAPDEFLGIEGKEVPNNIICCTSADISNALGGKLGANAMKTFEQFKQIITLSDVIVSCTFDSCGKKIADAIQDYLLLGIENFEHLASKAYSWCKDPNSLEMKELNNVLESCGKTLDIFKQELQYINESKQEQIPVILTGEPNNYATKDAFLREHPEYRLTSSWKEVKIVFTNSLESNTGKMKKAREKNIEIKLY